MVAKQQKQHYYVPRRKEFKIDYLMGVSLDKHYILLYTFSVFENG
jgi:hypothetical protein